jgi:hypothetical protein
MSKWKVAKWTALTLGSLVVFVVVGGIVFTSYATPTRRDAVRLPIYTIGDENYAKVLSAGQNVVKLGPLPLNLYPGGVAFQNYEDAAQHLGELDQKNTGWDVYRLSGDFELDTYKVDGQAYIDKSLLVIARASETADILK